MRRWHGSGSPLQLPTSRVSKNASTGIDPCKFEFVNEMQEVIGAGHDINFPVTASNSGVTIHRSDQAIWGKETIKDTAKADDEATTVPLKLHV